MINFLIHSFNLDISSDSMVWIIEVGYKKGVTDPVGFLTKKEIDDLGIHSVKEVRSISTYTITGNIGEEEVRKIGEELLSDNQIQEFGYRGIGVSKGLGHDVHNGWLVEVGFKLGVMDAVGLSAAKAIEILGVGEVKEVKTGNKFLIIGDISEEDVKKICERVLANSLIHKYRYSRIGGI